MGGRHRRTRWIGICCARSVLARAAGPAIALGAALLLWPPLPARAAPPTDDWSLERGDDDRALNEHRLDALRSNPFSNPHWRSLQRALGDRGRARLVERRRARAPDDAALRILSARVKLDAGEPAAAADLLSAVALGRSRFAAKALLLQSDTLESLSHHARAARVLLTRTHGMGEDTRRRYLERAFKLATRHGLTRIRREVGATWTSEFPDSATAWASRATSEEAHADFVAAASSYAKAVEHAPRAMQRVEWIKDHARALASANAPHDALTQMLSLLHDRRAVQAFDADDWANLLRYARAADALRPLGATLDAAVGRRQLHANWRAYWLRAKVAAALGEPSAPHWERGAREFPRRAPLLLGWMDALERAGDAHAVLELIAGWRRYDEDLVIYALEFATRTRALGDARTAGRAVERVRELAGRRPDGLGIVRDYFNAHGDLERGLELSERICALSPKDAVARRRLGDQYFQMDRLDDAVKTWNEIATLTRPRHEGWRDVAEIFLSQSGHGKPREMREHATRALERGLALAPADPGLHRIAGLLAEHRRDSSAAYDAWSRVLVFADADTALRDEARSRIVENIFRLPKRQRREALLRQLETDSLENLKHGALPTRIESARALAEIYLRQGRPEDVVSVWGRLVELAPQSHEVLLSYGRALRRANRPADAIRVLSDLASRGGGDLATPLLLLAELHVERGEAVAAIERAGEAATATRAPGPSIRIAAELRQRGDLESARDALRAAAKAFPEHPAPMFELGMLEMTGGDLPAAADCLTAALSRRGDDYLSKRAGSMALSLMSLTGQEAEFLSLLARESSANSSLVSRGLIAQTVELMSDVELRAWKREHLEWAPVIERELLRAFRGDPLTARASAARMLGRLHARHTGGELVRVATRIATPRSVSRTERRGLDRLRWGALLAAGTIDDADTLDALFEAATTSRDATVKIGATWALINSDHPDALALLGLLLDEKNVSDLKRALVCAGLARAGLAARGPRAWRLRPRIERARTLSRTATAITACEIANAVYTQDSQVRRLLPLLWSDDEGLAEVVVWRLGRTPHPEDNAAIGAALWRTYLSSSGQIRRAARAAVTQFYAAAPSPSIPAKVGRASVDRMPASISRWSRDLLHAAPVAAAWSAEASASAHEHLAQAVLEMERGPRFERLALAHWNQRCAMRSPLHGGSSGGRAGQAPLNCLLGGNERQPAPEQTNASALR